MNPPDAEPLDCGLDLPPGLRGTLFQQRIWQALAGVPAGSTASYADLARAIGIPGAVRAVVQNCGAGALAVVVPYHKVVRSDGALSGYRWGMDRKRALPDRKARQAAGGRRQAAGGRWGWG